MAPFAQGIVLGAFIQGFETAGRRYAGGSFDCFTPFSLLTGFALLFGYGLLGEMGSSGVPLIQAFAAGAILTMLTDTMIPEAYADGGNWTGLATVFGFATAFLLSTVS